jgi:hypothetical protein
LCAGTSVPGSGNNTNDCGPSATLNAHWKVEDWTPRCWHVLFATADSNIPGLPYNCPATDEGRMATAMETGDLTLMLTWVPSWSGA